MGGRAHGNSQLAPSNSIMDLRIIKGLVKLRWQLQQLLSLRIGQNVNTLWNNPIQVCTAYSNSNKCSKLYQAPSMCSLYCPIVLPRCSLLLPFPIENGNSNPKFGVYIIYIYRQRRVCIQCRRSSCLVGLSRSLEGLYTDFPGGIVISFLYKSGNQTTQLLPFLGNGIVRVTQRVAARMLQNTVQYCWFHNRMTLFLYSSLRNCCGMALRGRFLDMPSVTYSKVLLLKTNEGLERVEMKVQALVGRIFRYCIRCESRFD